MSQINDDSLNEYINHMCRQNPLTYTTLITNSIVTSRRLISEIEALENVLLKESKIKQLNLIMISSVKLELMIQEIIEIKQQLLEK